MIRGFVIVPLCLILFCVSNTEANISQGKYIKRGTVDGFATSLTTSKVKVNLRLMECADWALREGQPGFSLATQQDGRHCRPTIDADLLPVGTWTIYALKEAAVCIESDVETEIVVVRRDGSVNFNRLWNDYKAGFGNRNTEFWLGLDKLHELTRCTRYGLMVNVTAWDNMEYWAFYDLFRVGPESGYYTSTFEGYDTRSTLGNRLSSHNAKQFSTPDRDNDRYPGYDCAGVWQTGWWFVACYGVTPTGKYHATETIDVYGLIWYAHGLPYDNHYSFKEMSLTMIKL